MRDYYLSRCENNEKGWALPVHCQLYSLNQTQTPGNLHVEVEEANLAFVPVVDRVGRGSALFVRFIRLKEQVFIPFSVHMPVRGVREEV